MIPAFALVAAVATASPPPARARAEAAFRRGVDADTTAYTATGDLVHAAGRRVAFVCSVEQVVRDGVMIAQCGDPAEPVDLFVKLATARLKPDEKLRILGVVEPPAQWADVTGHVVSYAIVRAVFVDRL